VPAYIETKQTQGKKISRLDA